MENEQLYRLIEFINSKGRSYWIRWAVAIAGILYLLNLVVNFTFVHIHVERHDGIMQNVSILSSSQSQKDSPVFIVGELALIRRDTISLRAVSEPYQTNKSIPPLPLVGFTSVTINLYRDHDAEKYSGDSLGCVAYDKPINKVLSYDCYRPVNLVTYERPTDGGIWENKVLATMTDQYPPIYSIKPFMNGIIGIQQHPDSDKEFRNLVFTYDSNGKKTSYNLPPEINRNDIGNLSLVVDSVSTDSGKFMIINTSTGELYLGTLQNDTVTYRNSKVSDRYDSADALFCTLVSSVGYCYSGTSTEDSDNPYHNKDKDKVASTVEVIDFSKNNPTVSVYELSKEIGVNGIHVTRAKNIYITSKNADSLLDDIYSISLQDGKATPQLMLTNISSTSFGSGLMYVQNNAIYKIDDEKNESYLVFESKHLRISNLIPIGGDVFFTAFINDMTDQKIHTYKLLDHASQLPTGKRLVDLLPFYMGSSLLTIDYMDNTVRVRVFASSTVDRANNRLLYDEGEYGLNKSIVESRLNSLGITSDKYKIIYSK